MSNTNSERSAICYHEVLRNDLESILQNGLRLSSDGEKDTGLITKVNEFLDMHRPPHYRHAAVSRTTAVYGYLPKDNGVMSITTGETIAFARAVSDNDHVLLKLTVDPTRCYVSDLDLYDTIKDKIENGEIEE